MHGRRQHRSGRLGGILLVFSVATHTAAETKRKYLFVAGEKCEQKKNSRGEYHGEVACRESSWEGEKIESVTNYANGKKQGRRLEFHWNGKLKSEEVYQDDRLEGLAKYYDDSGLLIAEKGYRAGKLSGLTKSYYNRSLGCPEESYGRLASAENYLDDKLQGSADYYACNGKPEEVKSFSHGLLDGERRTYNTATGKLRDLRHYSAKYGVPNASLPGIEDKGLDGLQQSFREDGSLERTWYMKGGVSHGPDTQFHPNGQVRRTLCYQEGSEVDGLEFCKTLLSEASGGKKVNADLAETFFKNGKLESRFATKNGKRNGPYVINYDTGQPHLRGNYQDGELEGEAKELHPSGRLKAQATFHRGKKQGVEKEYYESGGPLRELQWADGKAVSEKNYWQNGKLKSEIGLVERKVVSKEYFDNGKLRFEGSFIEGNRPRWGSSSGREDSFRDFFPDLVPDGKHVTYYEDTGRPWEEMSYKDGKHDGVCRNFHGNGRLAQETQYKEDRLLSKKEYDSEGKLTLAEEYYEDGSRKSTR